MCETRPPDETYNDTLRQIRATDTTKGFEFLFERQYRTQNKRNLGKCKTPVTDGRVAPETEGNLEKATLSADVEQKSKNFYKGYRHKVPLIDGNATAFYLQLASEYYQQGFLKNLKYLESIGARSSSVHARKRQKNTTTTQQKPREGGEETTIKFYQPKYSGKDNDDEQSNGNGNSRPQSAATDTTISTNNSESDVTITPRKLDNTHNNTGSGSFRLARRLLQSIAQRKSFRKKVFEDWGQIRVNITPAVRQDNSSDRNDQQQQQYTKEAISNTNSCHLNLTTNTTTMNDYLNANALDQKHHNNSNNNPNHHNNSSSDYNKVKTREHFHSLIDNLQQLEIGDIDLLPKITLTDYCSSSAYSSSNDATNNTEHTSAEATTDRATDTNQQRRNCRVQQQQERVAKFILKQSKFDFNKSLEIPNENVYHSEARPP